MQSAKLSSSINDTYIKILKDPEIHTRWREPTLPQPLSISVMTQTIQKAIRVVVSCNGEQYRVVDITGASDGSWIRERIYSKLNIPDDVHVNFAIYPSQIGSLALGDYLGDDELFTLCRKYGNPSGSLTFFVSTSPNSPPENYDPGYNSDLPSFFTGHRSH